MDLITQTSLEALLLKATNSSNQNIDTAALEAFCTLINKEKDGALIGVKVIANRIHSGVENEVLQTLNVLDSCMTKCGTHFQSEVGKFRFLNEMIKLVSPKYLGCQTPTVVKQKVLQLLYVWTLDFPKETKIKEAYEMLRKQGVVKEIPNPNVPAESYMPKKRVSSIFQDEEKSKILQKLLQSKDPEDIQAANWLIKSMVKEDEKQVELKSRKISELESAQNNIRLLNEMLDSYIAETTSKDEMDLIKELHQSCERLRPNLAKLAAETTQNEDILDDIIQINDELTHVFSKYRAIIIGGKSLTSNSKKTDDLSLLTLDFMSTEAKNPTAQENESKSNIDVLTDLFFAPDIPQSDVLKPEKLKLESKETTENRFKALDDLDILGEHLLEQNLKTCDGRKFFSSKTQDKVPMNLLVKKPEIRPNSLGAGPLDFDLSLLMKPRINDSDTSLRKLSNSGSGDDCLVDITDEKMLEPDCSLRANEKVDKDEIKENKQIKLRDLTVDLKDIRPGIQPPVVILEKNGVNVTLHHAKDRPRDDVRVFVVTTVNKNELSLSSYLFQAVAPKSCKLRLQPPSTTELQAFNPFLPPSAITQIMLIANPENVQLTLKFVLSYTIDEETVTEIGEVENL